VLLRKRIKKNLKIAIFVSSYLRIWSKIPAKIVNRNGGCYWLFLLGGMLELLFELLYERVVGIYGLHERVVGIYGLLFWGSFFGGIDIRLDQY